MKIKTRRNFLKSLFPAVGGIIGVITGKKYGGGEVDFKNTEWEKYSSILLAYDPVGETGCYDKMGYSINCPPQLDCGTHPEDYRCGDR